MANYRNVYLVLAMPASGKSHGIRAYRDLVIHACHLTDADEVPAVRAVYNYNRAKYGPKWWDNPTFQQLWNMSGMDQAFYSIYEQQEDEQDDKDVFLFSAEIKMWDAALVYSKARTGRSRLRFRCVSFAPSFDEHITNMAKRISKKEKNFTTDEAGLRRMHQSFRDKIRAFRGRSDVKIANRNWDLNFRCADVPYIFGIDRSPSDGDPHIDCKSFLSVLDVSDKAHRELSRPSSTFMDNDSDRTDNRSESSRVNKDATGEESNRVNPDYWEGYGDSSAEGMD